MNNWFVNSTDVEQAFLHCNLHETIYMQQPAGLEEDSNKVWRLKKGLYGLSQASRLFFKHLAARLKEFGFVAAMSNECVFVLQRGTSVLIFCTVVDNILQVGNNPELLLVQEVLSKFYTVTDDWPVT
eukprot:2147025-Rhodomonas_salina.1